MFILHHELSLPSAVAAETRRGLDGITSVEKHPDVSWLIILVGTLVLLAVGLRIFMTRVEKRAFQVSDWLTTISLV